MGTAALRCPPRVARQGFAPSPTEALAVFPIQQIPHGFPPSRVRSLIRLQNVGRLSLRLSFLLAARRAAVGKARLPRLQLEFLRANHADFDRKCHRNIMLQLAMAMDLLGSDRSAPEQRLPFLPACLCVLERGVLQRSLLRVWPRESRDVPLLLRLYSPMAGAVLLLCTDPFHAYCNIPR